MTKSEYALLHGVDYSQIGPFKAAMREVAKRTRHFPEKRHVFIEDRLLHAHGGVYEYRGLHPHRWCSTTEGLGNKNWIAEWMYRYDGTGDPHYRGIGIDLMMMAVNDNIAQAALPAVYTDEVAAGDSSWFADARRAADFAEGIFEGCRLSGAALVAGESPAIKYLVNTRHPEEVPSCPSLSGCVTGLIAPSFRLIDGSKLAVGDRIIGVTSSGLHANGVSNVIGRGLALEEKFLTKLPSGMTLGEAALIPTRCYVDLVESLLMAGAEIHAILPGTGGGVAKLAFDERPYTYRVHSWPAVPELFLFMRELGVSLMDCLTTFNWGVGYYLFVPPGHVDAVLAIAHVRGYGALEIGRVEEGSRQTIFGPEGDLVLLPPDE